MANLSKINVAILAGGFGTRLKSKFIGKPKVLAKVRNRPFLEYLLNQLNSANFKKIILCTGYLADKVEKAFGRKYRNLSLLYSQESIPLGTGGCLRYALPHFTSETVLVMNGDSFCNVDFKKFWQFHLRKNSKASIVLTSVSDKRDFGTVSLGIDNSIASFQEKKAGNEKGFVNVGIYLINKNLIAEVPKSKKISLEQDIFPNWIGRGFYGYKNNSNFIDIGTPESYAKAEKFFAKFKL